MFLQWKKMTMIYECTSLLINMLKGEDYNNKQYQEFIIL